MKILSNVFLMVIFCVVGVHVTAGEAVDDFIKKLESIESLSGNFTQTMQDADGKELSDPNKGFFQLQRPGKFYWHSEAPYEQFVIVSESGLMIYDPDLEQVTIYEKDTWQNSPAAVLSGSAETIREKYRIEKGSEKNRETYVLTELNKDQKSFEKLSFTFGKKGLDAMQLLDQLGQITDIQFNKVKMNQKLDSSLFAFKPPEDADVIVNQ